MEIYGCPGINYNVVVAQVVVAMYESWEFGEHSGSWSWSWLHLEFTLAPCSPNSPRASITRCTHAMHGPSLYTNVCELYL